MKVIVMCETFLQFRNYVDSVTNLYLSLLQNKTKLPATRTILNTNLCITIHIEDIEFIFCKNLYALKGRTFNSSDYIIKVGSWYNIPEKEQEAIITEFMSRVV